MTTHQKNLQKIKTLASELAECVQVEDYEKFPTPYTSCEDPEVFYCCGSSGMEFKIKRYSQLPYHCKTIVDDLVTSSQLDVFQQWDTNFRRMYYTKAIFMAYDLGKEKHKNFFSKIKEWFYNNKVSQPHTDIKLSLEVLEECAFIESGLASHGCLEKIDFYCKEAIMRYGRYLLKHQKQIIQ